MKRISLYLFSVGCLAVYVLSLNTGFMEWWADFRTYTLHTPYAKARYGDLYSNCYLPGYTDTNYIPLKKFGTGDEVDLYILHDSYLEGKVKKENFKDLHDLILLNYSTDKSVLRLDKKHKNVLIIESAERNAPWRMTDTVILYKKLLGEGPKNNSFHNKNKETEWKKLFFNPNINQNLEFSLYDYEYFIPIKEIKAAMNYHLFNRLPKDISLSADNNYLLLSETVDPSSLSSSFRPLDAGYILKTMEIMKKVCEHFKKLGFKEVYFSIIPNTATLVNSKRMGYNLKIPTIEGLSDTSVHFISVYNEFMHCPAKIFRRDDTHWNGYGLQLWVNQVNHTIAK